MKLNEINSYILEDITSSEHPSDFVKDSDYSALILQLPFMENGLAKVQSFAFVVTQDSVYQYDRDQKSLIHIGGFNDLYEKLDILVDRLLEDIKILHLKIDNLEDMIYQDDSGDIMVKWLSFKQSVSLIRRMIFNANIAFELFLKYYSGKDNFDMHAFHDIREHLERIKSLALMAEERLDHLYDFYKTRVDERMNRNMYYLTIISGIFLPLTLITGFFGINTGGLPWVNNENGTLYVIVVSAILEIIFLVTFLQLLRRERLKFRISHIL